MHRDDPERRITVGVLTFHRTGPLATLLPLLVTEAERHEAQAAHPKLDRVRILVVDNDPEGSARAVVTALAPELSGRIDYVVESRPGISAGRNRTLDECATDSLLAFIDDDETPEPGWLSALVAVHDTVGADAVAGPVVSRYAGALDPWVAAGGYFDREHHQGRANGSTLPRAASNNLLLDLQTVRRLGLRFDDAYGLSGGEDTLFTESLTRAGGTIRWASAAVVNDHVPAERLTREYAVRRTYDLANSSARVELALGADHASRHRLRGRAAAVATARLGVGGAQFAIGVLTRSQRQQARGRRSLARGQGALAAVVGRHPSSYGVAAHPTDDAATSAPGSGARPVWVAHPSSDLYGSDLQLVETVRGLRESGHDVVVVLPGEGPLTPHFTALGATVTIMTAPVLRKSLLSPVRLPIFALGLLRSSLVLRRQLRAARPSVLLVNTVTIPSWLVAGRAAGVPMLCHVHEAEADQPWPVRFALAAPLLLAQRVVTNSEASGEVIRKVLPSLSSRISLVYNGIAVPPTVGPPRERHPDHPLRLVLVGRLSPRKGTDVALEALAAVRAAGIDASLSLCGSVFPGYEWFEDQLRLRASAPDLVGHVRFLGYVASPATELAAADIVLVPSRVEPFGNAAVEGLLAQRPVIASRTQGLQEIVRPGQTGLLVAPGDASQLALAIQDLAADPDRAALLAENGLTDARERFSVERYRRDMTAHVEALGDPTAERLEPAPTDSR